MSGRQSNRRPLGGSAPRYVVTLPARPPARHDGVTWQRVQVEQAGHSQGPWDRIDDQAAPSGLAITTARAVAPGGYFRLIWIDDSGARAPGPSRYIAAASADLATPRKGEHRMAATLHTRSIPEQLIDEARLGRHVAHDPLSLSYPATAAAALKSVAHKAVGLPLFQKRGSCTAEAWCGAMNSSPDFKGRTFTQADAEQLYNREITLEGGNPATDDPGGSGLMVCRAAKALGWGGSYRHAFGLEHALRALVLRPVMFGVNWYSGFDTPDSTGLVQITGRIRGGHEFVGLEIDEPNEDVWLAQSWPLPYGVARPSIGLDRGGAFRMKFATIERLLNEEGDCTVPYPAKAAA